MVMTTMMMKKQHLLVAVAAVALLISTSSEAFAPSSLSMNKAFVASTAVRLQPLDNEEEAASSSLGVEAANFERKSRQTVTSFVAASLFAVSTLLMSPDMVVAAAPSAVSAAGAGKTSTPLSTVVKSGTVAAAPAAKAKAAAPAAPVVAAEPPMPAAKKAVVTAKKELEALTSKLIVADKTVSSTKATANAAAVTQQKAEKSASAAQKSFLEANDKLAQLKASKGSSESSIISQQTKVGTYSIVSLALPCCLSCYS
jgi:hypothetical protein